MMTDLRITGDKPGKELSIAHTVIGTRAAAAADDCQGIPFEVLP